MPICITIAYGIWAWRGVIFVGFSIDLLHRCYNTLALPCECVIIIIRVCVKSTNVVCPHNGTYDLCIFAIFSKTGFVDIVPLCCKISICVFLYRYELVTCINGVWYQLQQLLLNFAVHQLFAIFVLNDIVCGEEPCHQSLELLVV